MHTQKSTTQTSNKLYQWLNVNLLYVHQHFLLILRQETLCNFKIKNFNASETEAMAGWKHIGVHMKSVISLLHDEQKRPNPFMTYIFFGHWREYNKRWNFTSCCYLGKLPYLEFHGPVCSKARAQANCIHVFYKGIWPFVLRVNINRKHNINVITSRLVGAAWWLFISMFCLFYLSAYLHR